MEHLQAHIYSSQKILPLDDLQTKVDFFNKRNKMFFKQYFIFFLSYDFQIKLHKLQKRLAIELVHIYLLMFLDIFKAGDKALIKAVKQLIAEISPTTDRAEDLFI